MFESLGFLISLFWWVLVIGFVVWLLKRSKNSAAQPVAPGMSIRDMVVAALVISAGFCGIISAYYFPLALFGDGDQSKTAVFAGRLVFGVVLLIGGLILRHLTGNFMMVIGVMGLVLAAPFVFENYGSAGAFIVVLIAFAALIAFTLHMHKKSQPNG